MIPAFPVRTYQATIAQLTEPLSCRPSDPAVALPGAAASRSACARKLGDNLDGVREYMSPYPYTCLEQHLSRAVALRDRAEWDALDGAPAGLPWIATVCCKYFPTERLDGDDALTAYVLAIADEAGWEIPEATRAAA